MNNRNFISFLNYIVCKFFFASVRSSEVYSVLSNFAFPAYICKVKMTIEYNAKTISWQYNSYLKTFRRQIIV